jgi:type II secretory pathway pseudopilin PulG
MKLRTRRSSSPFRNSGLGTSARSRGYALLVVMMMAVILLVSLSAALPSVYTAGQREREEELIFRGNQYARAIATFHRQFNRYPVSIEELLRTNGIRFLRRAYPDPMSRTGKWRFIHANAAGAVLDSVATPGSAGSPGQAGSSSQTGLMASSGSAPSDSKGPPGSPSDFNGQGSAVPGGANQMNGAFIIGVASSSPRESIRVWNNHTHYDAWEFLGGAANSRPTSRSWPGARARAAHRSRATARFEPAALHVAAGHSPKYDESYQWASIFDAIACLAGVV